MLLGTGGGLVHAAARLKGSGTILVRNSDFLADIALSSVVASHLRSGCPATIVVVPHRDGYTRVAIDDRNRVTAFGGKSAGRLPVHRLSPGRGIRSRDDPPRGAVRHRAGRLLRSRRERESQRIRARWVLVGVWRAARVLGRLHAIGQSSPPISAPGWEISTPCARIGGALASVGAGADLTAAGIELGGTLAIGLGVRVGERATLWIRWSCRKHGSARDRRCDGASSPPARRFRAASKRRTACSRPIRIVRRRRARGVERVAGLLAEAILGRDRGMSALRPELDAAIAKLYRDAAARRSPGMPPRDDFTGCGFRIPPRAS